MTIYTVGASSDDCYVCRSGTYLSLTTSAPCGDASAGWYDLETGMRWTVDIAQGATITSAYLKLVAQSNVSNEIPTTIIAGEDADDPATFSDWTDYDGRTRTSQSVNWTPSAWVAGTTYTSGDIASIIQAIVNRAGFGTHLVLFWSHALGWGGTTNDIYGAAWDHASYNPPKLEVNYSVAGQQLFTLINEMGY